MERKTAKGVSTLCSFYPIYGINSLNTHKNALRVEKAPRWENLFLTHLTEKVKDLISIYDSERFFEINECLHSFAKAMQIGI